MSTVCAGLCLTLRAPTLFLFYGFKLKLKRTADHIIIVTELENCSVKAMKCVLKCLYLPCKLF